MYSIWAGKLGIEVSCSRPESLKNLRSDEKSGRLTTLQPSANMVSTLVGKFGTIVRPELIRNTSKESEK